MAMLGIILLLTACEKKSLNSKLIVTPSSLNFSVWSDSETIQSITLRNSSNVPVLIKEMEADCGCIFIDSEEGVREILPGQSLDVKVKYIAPIVYTELNSKKEILIKTQNNFFSIPIIVQVKPRVQLSESRVDLGKLNKLEERKLDIKLKRNDSSEFSPKVLIQPFGAETILKQISLNEFMLSIKIGKLAMSCEEWQDEVIEIELNKQNKIRIQISGSRQTDMQVSPAILNFGMISNGQTKQMETFISNKRLGDQFKIYRITCNPTVKVNLKEVKLGQYKLVVEWPSNNKIVGNVQNYFLTLHSNDLEQPQYMVKILGMVPKTAVECCGN